MQRRKACIQIGEGMEKIQQKANIQKSNVQKDREWPLHNGGGGNHTTTVQGKQRKNKHKKKNRKQEKYEEINKNQTRMELKLKSRPLAERNEGGVMERKDLSKWMAFSPQLW